jgi:hypothetical protein
MISSGIDLPTFGSQIELDRDESNLTSLFLLFTGYPFAFLIVNERVKACKMTSICMHAHRVSRMQKQTLKNKMKRLKNQLNKHLFTIMITL